MSSPAPRRYIVKCYAGSPAWSGCTWAQSCKTLEAAKALFSKKIAAFEAGKASADAILLIDRQANQVLLSVGTDKPEKVTYSYGW
jgi:hypothetical protein